MNVVAAVIDRNGRFLVTRRQEGVHLEGFWEFPGGKVDEGETHADALRREIFEELNAEADIGELVLATAHAYPERTVALYFYACTLRNDPQPVLGQEMRWVAPAELRDLPFPPADEELIRELASR